MLLSPEQNFTELLVLQFLPEVLNQICCSSTFSFFNCLCFNHRHNKTRTTTVLFSFHLIVSTDEVTYISYIENTLPPYAHNWIICLSILWTFKVILTCLEVAWSAILVVWMKLHYCCCIVKVAYVQCCLVHFT